MSRRKKQDNPRRIRVSLASALDRHFMGCAAVATAAAVGSVQHANAAVIYSGVQDIALSNGAPGVYLNLVTKNHTGIPAGWDINPYVNAPNPFFGMYNAAAGTDVKSTLPGAGAGDVAKLNTGDLIGPASTFIAAKSTVMNTATAGAWAGAGAGFMGVKFTESGVNGGAAMYGWVQFTKDAGIPSGNPTGITIVDWAYDDSGASITAGAGAVPEPSSLALLAAGAMGLCVRRGRAKLRKV